MITSKKVQTKSSFFFHFITHFEIKKIHIAYSKQIMFINPLSENIIRFNFDRHPKNRIKAVILTYI